MYSHINAHILCAEYDTYSIFSNCFYNQVLKFKTIIIIKYISDPKKLAKKIMNLYIKSRKSSQLTLKELSFKVGDSNGLFPKSFNALHRNNLQTINQKPARFVASNDHLSSSGFLSGDNLNVNTYVDRRLPPGRDPCGNRRRKPS